MIDVGRQIERLMVRDGNMCLYCAEFCIGSMYLGCMTCISRL